MAAVMGCRLDQKRWDTVGELGSAEMSPHP
jgi:hypothetical protein